jgi:hypothetical protein
MRALLALSEADTTIKGDFVLGSHWLLVCLILPVVRVASAPKCLEGPARGTALHLLDTTALRF